MEASSFAQKECTCGVTLAKVVYCENCLSRNEEMLATSIKNLQQQSEYLTSLTPEALTAELPQDPSESPAQQAQLERLQQELQNKLQELTLQHEQLIKENEVLKDKIYRMDKRIMQRNLSENIQAIHLNEGLERAQAKHKHLHEQIDNLKHHNILSEFWRLECMDSAKQATLNSEKLGWHNVCSIMGLFNYVILYGAPKPYTKKVVMAVDNEENAIVIKKLNPNNKYSEREVSINCSTPENTARWLVYTLEELENFAQFIGVHTSLPHAFTPKELALKNIPELPIIIYYFAKNLQYVVKWIQQNCQ